MNKRIILWLFLFALFSVYSLEITEIEINPSEGRFGKEWIELFNEENSEADISGFMVYDGLAKEQKRYTVPNGTKISPEDYFIIEFSSAVLNNDGDYVIIKDFGGSEVEKTENLKETTSSSKTWQLCNGEWAFMDSSKSKENDCEIDDEDNSNINEEENDNNPRNESEDEEEINDKSDEDEGDEVKQIEKTNEEDSILETVKNTKTSQSNIKPIVASSKSIKSKENSGFSDSPLAYISLGLFCGLIGGLFYLRKKQKEKLQ